MNRCFSLSLCALTVGLIAPLASVCAQRTIVTVAEDPGQVNSSLSGVDVFDFNSLSLGMNYNVGWDGVGTFDQLNILKPNQYGGAPDATNPKGSLYSVQGVNKIASTTLTLETPSSYFGFWWSAGDAANQLTFYSGEQLVAQYTTSSLLGTLPRTYYGNPIDKNLVRHEPFAFINFFGEEGTSWDRVVFTNLNLSSGFESDNYTSRVFSLNPEVDGKDAVGTVVATVEGTTTTKTSELPQDWVWTTESKAPAAPLPPAAVLALFVGLWVFRGFFRPAASAA